MSASSTHTSGEGSNVNKLILHKRELLVFEFEQFCINGFVAARPASARTEELIRQFLADATEVAPWTEELLDIYTNHKARNSAGVHDTRVAWLLVNLLMEAQFAPGSLFRIDHWIEMM